MRELLRTGLGRRVATLTVVAVTGAAVVTVGFGTASGAGAATHITSPMPRAHARASPTGADAVRTTDSSVITTTTDPSRARTACAFCRPSTTHDHRAPAHHDDGEADDRRPRRHDHRPSADHHDDAPTTGRPTTTVPVTTTTADPPTTTTTTTTAARSVPRRHRERRLHRLALDNVLLDTDTHEPCERGRRPARTVPCVRRTAAADSARGLHLGRRVLGLARVGHRRLDGRLLGVARTVEPLPPVPSVRISVAASPSIAPPPPATSTSGTTVIWPSATAFATATSAVAV